MALSHLASNTRDVSPVGHSHNPFEDVHSSQYGIEPNYAGDVDVIEIDTTPRFSLRGAAMRAKQALRRQRAQSLPAPVVRSPDPHRGTAADLRRRLGHEVPDPPSTWGPQGHRDDDVGLLPLPDSPESKENEDVYSWTAERLDILDSMVNTTHQRMIEELQQQMMALQSQLDVVAGNQPTDTMRSTNQEIKMERYQMSRLSSPAGTSPDRAIPGDEISPLTHAEPNATEARHLPSH